MDKRIIPTKNYFIFAVIAILSFAIVFNLAKIYKEIKSEKNTSQINLTISEVLEAELNEYLTENDSKIIYIASSKNESIFDFENDLKSYLVKEQIENKFVYLDLSKISDTFKITFFNTYLKTKFEKVKLDYSNMIYFKDKAVEKVLYQEDKEINIKDVEAFVEMTEELND